MAAGAFAGLRTAGRPGGKSGLHGNRVPGNARRGKPLAHALSQGAPGRTSGKAPQKANRRAGPLISVSFWCAAGGHERPGKGERVRQERTAPLATGAARQAPPGARPNRDGTPGDCSRAGRVSGPAVRVGRARRMATCVPDEWPSPASLRGGGQNPAYRPASIKTPPARVHVGGVLIFCAEARAVPARSPAWATRYDGGEMAGGGKRAIFHYHVSDCPPRSPSPPPSMVRKRWEGGTERVRR